MQPLLTWSILTALVVSVVTFALNFFTSSLGIRLVIALFLLVAAVVHYARKHGVPDSAFSSGATLALAAMAGLLIVQTTDVLEYAITLLLFIIAFFVGGLISKWTVKKPEQT